MSYEPETYWQDRAQSWVNETFDTPADWQQIKEFVRPDLPTWEIGCGTGRWAPYFPEYVGSDVAPTLVAHCEAAYPEKTFFQHNLGVDPEPQFVGNWSQIFTYTALEHVPPEALARVKFPETARLVFVEPHTEPGVEHCFKHDYESLFGVQAVKVMENLTVWVREPETSPVKEAK